MDLTCSPHREGGGALHLPSPTHSYRVDNFPSIKQIRRSLSHSPSKPTRFHLFPRSSSGLAGATTTTTTPSPLSFPKAFDTTSATDLSAFASRPPSPSNGASTPNSTRNTKFTPRRNLSIRSSTRTRSTRSPVRYALKESANGSNMGLSSFDGASDKEEMNLPIPFTARLAAYDKSAQHERDSEPVRFEAPQIRAENIPLSVKGPFDSPVKSSPLKRSDGIMNLDQANLGSPMAKRRSLHGAPFGPDFDIFDQGLAVANQDASSTEQDRDNGISSGSTSTPNIRRASHVPMQRSLSLRKTTLQHRRAPSPRPRSPSIAPDRNGDPASSGTAACRSPHRRSLDASTSFGSHDPSTPLRPTPHVLPRAEFDLARPLLRPERRNQPHPLSHALSTTSSSSGMVDDSPTHVPTHPPSHVVEAMRQPNPFARSLPVGISRNTARDPSRDGGQNSTNNETMATPDTYRMAKPLPAAFMSTGLISKRNRRVDLPLNGSLENYAMPDTPSKRVSFPPALNTPSHADGLTKSIRQLDDLSSGTPFSPKSPRFFGSPVQRSGISAFPFRRPVLPRRESFTSIDGDEWPSTGLPTDTQSSNDELPPTPTKPNTNSARTSQSKRGSLRSSLLDRRSSLGLETFVRPTDPAESTSNHQSDSPPHSSHSSTRVSPHTPQEKFAPPDPSGLSISGKDIRRGSTPFHNSFGNGSAAFPPATPTAPRDQPFRFGAGQAVAAPLVGLRPHDWDTSLGARFENVTLYGNGEFSKVYRVEKPIAGAQASPSTPRSAAAVWAVKKSKRQYSGSWDRQRKLREVEILKRLREHDNIIQLTDSWEANHHLYIQTEFCENGNLRDFLTSAGYKARLDDFRIWKILLELTSGVKSIHDAGFIHLDLKPANVFIDWEGVLKIGDFGLASPWPAPSDIDGEGDREYIGPEVLTGRIDKPSDIFALGMIMLEIAGNIVLPDNGDSWQRLRSGNFSDVPSLTWSSDTTLARDETGDPIMDRTDQGASFEPMQDPDEVSETFTFVRDIPSHILRPRELVWPPNFMVDVEDAEALDKIVQWMVSPVPSDRPVVNQVQTCMGVQWVEKRRRAGATIYEGNWGPSNEVLHGEQDVDMAEAP